MWSSELACVGGTKLALNEQCGGTTRYRSFTPIAGPYKGACCPEGSSCTRLDDKKWTCKLPVSRMASEWRRAGRRCRCLSRAHMLQACGAALPRTGRALRSPAVAMPVVPGQRKGAA